MFRLNFFILLLLGFVDHLGIGLVYPIFAVLLFDTSDPMLAVETSTALRGGILGILVGLTPLSAFIFAPFLGAFSDSYGRKKAILFGMASGCLGYSLALLAFSYHSLSLLFLFRILIGATQASAAVAQAAVADVSTEENKARRFSLFSSSAGLGFTIGPFVGGRLAEIDGTGYFLPFLLAGSLCLINFLLVWGLFPQSAIRKKELSFKLSESVMNIRKVFLWKHLRWLFAVSFCGSFAWAFFNEFMPVLLQAHFAFTLSAIGNYFAWGGIWFSISSGLLTAPLLARYSKERLVMVALAGCAICMALFSIIEEAVWIWILVPILMFFLATAFPTLASLVSNRTDETIQGEVLGVYHSIQGCAMGLSPLFVGSLIGAYPALTGWGAAMVMGLACVICFRGSRKEAQLSYN